MHTYVNIGYTLLSCFFTKSRGGLSGWRKNLWYFFRWVNIYPHGHHLLLTIFWTQHRLSSGSSHGPSGKAACSQTATDVLFTQLQSTLYLGSPGLSIMTGKIIIVSWYFSIAKIHFESEAFELTWQCILKCASWCLLK